MIVLNENFAMKTKTETELTADCHGETEVNLVSSLALHIIFRSLGSLVNLNQRHEVATTISVEVFTVVLSSVYSIDSADTPADPHFLRLAIEYAVGRLSHKIAKLFPMYQDRLQVSEFQMVSFKKN